MDTSTANILSDEFINSHKDKQVPWGFGGLGFLVYKRTYSRVKEDGSSEEWYETVARCVNGAQKIGAGYTKEEAQRLYDHIFNLRCNFAGRMLWQLGTSKVDRYGANSLINCFFIAINKPSAFQFMFENLMMGGGVGFSVRREDVHELPRIKVGVNVTHQKTNDADFIVPDSREGWVKLLGHVLDAFYVTGKSFTYSTILVRCAGEKIKGFGGTASGPDILTKGIDQIVKIFQSREEKKLRSIDVLDICNNIASIVVAGNIRRSATIALGDPDDYLFIRAKNWSLGTIPNWRGMSNNTIYADAYDHISSEIWANGYEIDSKTGKATGEPYGFFNLPLTQKYGRLKDGPIKDSKMYPTDKDNCVGINPCLTGDTMVYLADGRGHLPIKQLAQEGKDVPVFCLDSRGKTAIRYMRNPRVTGNDVAVYRVTIEGGHSFTVTANHKLRLSDGTYREAQALRFGDSLKILTKFHASLKNIFPKANSQSQDYVWLNDGGSRNKAEHTYIAEFHFNTPIPTGTVVHHKDFDAQNNRPDNLQIMTKEDHDFLHSRNMFGDKNPMRRAATEWSEEKWKKYRGNLSDAVAAEKNGHYSGFTNEQLKEHALTLTEVLGRRFSLDEWREYAKPLGLPQQFSGWRHNHLGGIVGLAKWAALEEGIDLINADPRLVRSYRRALEGGYDAFIQDGRVYVNKVCEVSGRPFVVPYAKREVSIIDMSGENRRRWRDSDYRAKTIASIHQTWNDKKLIVREKQSKVWADLRFQLGRAPLKKEWKQGCHQAGVSSEISRSSSPFCSYAELSEVASMYNHKVVSVERVGTETVYNGTVDDFHNFFIGGWEEKTVTGKPKFIYINNLQCGEIGLFSGESCDLSELYLNNILSKEQLIDCAKLLYKTIKAISAMQFLHDETNTVVHKNMRLGLGVTGVCQSLDKLDWLDDCYVALRRLDKEWSRARGWPESIKLTTVKPSGSLSLLAGATPGVHPAMFPFYIRRVRMATDDKLTKLCRDAGYHVEFLRGFDGKDDRGTSVVSFPCETPKGALLAKDVGVIQQLEMVKKMQTIWSDNAVSVTAYYEPEELPLLKDWLKVNYENGIKSVSFLLRDRHGFDQAPYSEITEEEYHELTSKIKPLVAEPVAAGDMLALGECANGSCPIR